MQRNNSPILLATIALGLLAILGAAFFFLSNQGSAPQQQQAANQPTPTPAPIERWVAARNIPPRTVVTSAMIRKTSLSAAADTPDAITKLDDIRGQITKEAIAAGEVVTKGAFNPRLARVIPASFEIPTGYRAVAIYVDPDQTAAGLVDIGDRVDVVATHRLTQQKENNTMVIGAMAFTAGRLIASNLLVLGVDKSINAPKPTPTPAPGEGAAPGAAVAGGPPPPPTPPPPPPAPGVAVRTRVLLAAPPEIATALVAAGDQGTLNVIIRNPMDSDVEPVAEQREYPSFQVRVPPTPAPPVSGGGGGNGGGGRMIEPPLPQPLSPAMPTTVLPPPASPTTPSETDGMADVTVIRGTEKTRVLVPNR